MRNGIWTKGLVVGIILLFVVSSGIASIKGSFDTTFMNDNSRIENKIQNLNDFHMDVPSFLDRNVLEGNDEGPHQNMIFDAKEWWYYNVYLNGENSELKNWFILMSIQLYPRYGGFKLVLFDDENNSYGGDDFLFFNDKVYGYGPGVNVFFNNSFEIGRYPNWHIYAEYVHADKPEIIVNLTFKANSLPIWLIKNTGHNRSNSIFGYYCILNCSAYGTISLNGIIYNVSGLGYHDHTWAPFRLNNTTRQNIGYSGENKFPNLLRIWDWLGIHFDNGWDMFVGKIYTDERYLSSKFKPGSLCFTMSGVKFYEIYFFLLDFEETKNSSAPGIEFPTKVHIKAFFLSTLELKKWKRLVVLDFYYEVKNIREQLYERQKFGYWVSHGKIYGFVKSFGLTIPLNGWAVMETTSTI